MPCALCLLPLCLLSFIDHFQQSITSAQFRILSTPLETAEKLAVYVGLYWIVVCFMMNSGLWLRSDVWRLP